MSTIYNIFFQDDAAAPSIHHSNAQRKRNVVQIQFRSYPINFTLIYLNSFWSTDSLRGAYSVKRVLQAQRWCSITLLFLPINSLSRVYNSSTWIELQAGRLVHRTEKIVRARIRIRSRIVSYCSIGIYVLDARFAPSSGRQPHGSILDVHCAISGEIVERTTIKLYRISESLSVLAILELSVIDGP